MFLICLLALLAGTPLRQAEAASDYARWMAEQGQHGVLEAVDGGVGDDPEVLLSNTHESRTDQEGMAPFFAAPFPAGFALPAVVSLTLSPRLEAGSLTSLPRPGRRNAWLQCFLF